MNKDLTQTNPLTCVCLGLRPYRSWNVFLSSLGKVPVPVHREGEFGAEKTEDLSLLEMLILLV